MRACTVVHAFVKAFVHGGACVRVSACVRVEMHWCARMCVHMWAVCSSVPHIIASNSLFPLLKVKVNRGRTIELNHLSGKYQKIGDCRDKGAQKFFTTIQCIEDKANL